MIDDFILNALMAGVLIAAIAGPLGCFMVWRKMAYFGDTISHSALMGVSLGIAFDSENPIIMIGTCSAIALILLFYSAIAGIHRIHFLEFWPIVRFLSV